MAHVASSRMIVVGGFVWMGLAAAAGVTGLFAALRVPAPQLVILGLSLATIVAATRVAPVQAWVDTLSLRTLVGFHAVRFVGAVFLVLSARGLISPLFATPAGWGDVVAAAAALGLLAMGPPDRPARRALYLAWNSFGVLDLIVAVGSATMVVLRGEVPGMEPILRFPLVLVPTFFVPLLLASHAVVFRRLASRKAVA